MVINILSLLDTAYLKKYYWKINNSYRSYVSLPVLSKDKKIVFISYEFYCGNECGKEGIEAFVKTKSGWKNTNRFHVPIAVF
jgi:hypothetical protein